jgi:hypothetical protein
MAADATKELHMMKWIAGMALGAALLAAPTRAEENPNVGKPPPEFKATKWYNTAPISLDDLKGKAVHLVVFRTW